MSCNTYREKQCLHQILHPKHKQLYVELVFHEEHESLYVEGYHHSGPHSA